MFGSYSSFAVGHVGMFLFDYHIVVSLFSLITLNNFLVFVIFLTVKHGYCCIHATSLGINKGVHYNTKPKMLTLPDQILKIS